jgi:hypothetical protein
VLYERASLATMLPILGEFVVLLLKKRPVSSGHGQRGSGAAKERANGGGGGGELSTSSSSLAVRSSPEESAAMSLLFSALSVMYVLVRSSERCRRAILWDEKDELEEQEKRKNEECLPANDAEPAAAVKLEEKAGGGAASAMTPHGHLRNSRILVGRRGGDDNVMDVEGKGKEKEGSDVDPVMVRAAASLQRNRSLASLFLLGQDTEPEDEDYSAAGESEQDFFAMLAQRDAHEASSVASEERFQLLPAYLDAVRHRQDTAAYDPPGGKQRQPAPTARELLKQARQARSAQVHTPKLLGLLINRVLKRREISLFKHGEVIGKALQVLNTLAWHCPSHLLHK